MNRIAIALLGSVLVLSPGISFGNEGNPSLEALVVEMAQTPKQHSALARYFHEKADEERTEADRHDAMGKSYVDGKITQRIRMSEHCKRISANHRANAKEYEGLAKLHEAEARGGK